jgi:hypothetical protein
LDHNKKVITVDDLVTQYYNNPDSFFLYSKSTLHEQENEVKGVQNEPISTKEATSLIREREKRTTNKDSNKGDTHIQEQLKDIPKESWTAITTCIYCNESVANTELVAHMDKCAAEAVAEYERRKSEGIS